MACTAHTDLPEGAKLIEQPFWKESVLDDLNSNDKEPAVVKLMSEWHR